MVIRIVIVNGNNNKNDTTKKWTADTRRIEHENESVVFIEFLHFIPVVTLLFFFLGFFSSVHNTHRTAMRFSLKGKLLAKRRMDHGEEQTNGERNKHDHGLLVVKMKDGHWVDGYVLLWSMLSSRMLLLLMMLMMLSLLMDPSLREDVVVSSIEQWSRRTNWRKMNEWNEMNKQSIVFLCLSTMRLFLLLLFMMHSLHANGP